MAIYPAKVIRPIVGNIYEAIDGSLYGYSGMVSYDITASERYEMMRFNLTQDSRFKMNFAYDGDVADTVNAGVGILIDIDGNEVYRLVDDRRLLMNPNQVSFYVPENATVVISLLNPNETAGIIQANVTLNGHYLEKAENKGSAGVQIGDDALPPMIAQRERMVGWNKELF